MPLPVPKLDDRTFDQLVAEGRALIPRYSKEWTNHNPSDPGITLMELFAFLTELAIFQADQIPAASIENFLRLAAPSYAGEPNLFGYDGLPTPVRAVTASEFETVACQVSVLGLPAVVRAKCVVIEDTLCVHPSNPDPGEPVEMAIVILVPDDPTSDSPVPPAALIKAVLEELSRRRVLATRCHVVGPEYIDVAITATVVRKPGSRLTEAAVEQAMRDFLHPLRGGQDGQGWPFGRAVYYSEIYQRLEGLPGVDHVAELALALPGQAPTTDEGIEVPPLALVSLRRVAVTITNGGAV